MPCTVTKAEEEYYERAKNEKLYGEKELTGRITERVACELANLIESRGLSGELSSVASKWIEIHKQEDLSR